MPTFEHAIALPIKLFDSHVANANGHNCKNHNMYEEFKSRVLDLDDTSVEAKKLYISFMYESAVCQVIVQNTQLKVFLNSKYLNSAHFSNQGKLRDVSNIGHWGSLNTEYIIRDFDELDDAVFYVKKIVSAMKDK